VYLFSTTQFVELLKIPVLVEHFKEHRLENPSITLLRFLDIHYMHGCPIDNDYDRDMQLPFKVPTHSVLATVSYTVPVPFRILLATVQFGEHEPACPKGTSFYSFNYLSAIWQPPRIS
jgi:hypothetical protein